MEHGILHPTIRTNLLHLTDTYNGGRHVRLWFDRMENTNYAIMTELDIMISEETLLIEPMHFVHVAADIVQGYHQRRGLLFLGLRGPNVLRQAEELLVREVPFPLEHVTHEDTPFQEILDRLFDDSADNAHPPEHPVSPTAGVYRRWRKQDAKTGKIGSMCTICQEDFRSNQKIRVMHEKCTYHEKCINKWFEYKSDCPNCKRGF